MCGIAGIVLTPSDRVKAEWLRTLFGHLEHRGPDDSGWLASWRGKVTHGSAIPHDLDLVADAVLLHKRLSILDLTMSGHQPMVTADGRYGIIFNGEIYNYLELRNELETLGRRFRSRSDTEVLLAAFAQWGVQGLPRLVGMFAFALLDLKTRRLWLARDFFGIKPLYYAYWQNGFAFASEIQALLELPGVTREMNAQRLCDYLRSGMTDHGGETLFAKIKQLPAAHYMAVSLDEPREARPVRYWEIDVTQRTEWSFEDAAARLRELFLESVRLHLRSDVPVGAALSGGIDSSSVVMAMRHLDRHVDIHTFSYIAEDPTISEERWVDLMTDAARTRAYKVKPSEQELTADLDRLIGVQGEPFISTSMYAQFRVFQRAREAGIKVMLDGQGADELLSGYPNYRLARICSLLRQGGWREAVALAKASNSREAASRLLCRALGRLSPATMQNVLRHIIRSDRMPAWMNASWFLDQGVSRKIPAHFGGKEMLRQELYESVTTTSLPQLLHYEDRNSMAFSIESRVPFLTPALAKFVFALPEGYLLAPNGNTKAIFRQAMRGIVPDAVLNRRDKLGFPTPERDWLLSLRGWVERVLLSPAAQSIGALDIHEVRRQWGEIVEGRRQYDSRVWRWVNLILWTEKFSATFE